MSRKAKRPTYKAMSQSQKSTVTSIKSAHKTQENVFGSGRKNVENIVHSAESYGRAMVGSLGLCSREINTLAKSGTIGNEAMRMLGKIIMQGYVVSFAHTTEFVRDALKCGSIDDLNALQADYTHRVANDYFNEATKLCELLFNSYQEALEPLNECMTLATKQGHKLIAA
jgi:hypothetical protein